MTPPRPALARAALALALALGMAACSRGPKAIRYGQDECAECKMTLVDRHYGAELITAKGKVHTFDDLNCLLTFQRRDATNPGSAASLVVIAFNRSGVFLPVEQAFFLRHDRLHTPMGSGLAAFATAAELETARTELGGGGQVIRWPDFAKSP
jgi:copper chaperone NosL